MATDRFVTGACCYKYEGQNMALLAGKTYYAYINSTGIKEFKWAEFV
jgi:hypothetical protein